MRAKKPSKSGTKKGPTTKRLEGEKALLEEEEEELD